MPPAYLLARAVYRLPLMPQPSGCRGKRTYQTRDDAEITRLTLLSEHRAEPVLGAYHCRHCGRFHLGRKAR